MSTAGPNSPSSGADDASIGVTAWTSPGNITASDDVRATCVLSSFAASHYLIASGFGFSIPAGASVDGIVVEWERSKSASGDDISDAESRIVKGGAIGSTDKAAAGQWPTTDAYASYGGAADLWGQTWTASDINASNFGAALRATAGFSTGGTAQVDHVRITVSYTVAATQMPGVQVVARRVEVPAEPQFSE